MIKVLLFGQLREILEVSELDLEDIPDTVQQLLQVLAMKGPLWQQYLLSNDVLVAINQTLVDKDSKLNNNDEVALFPPVTGG